MFFIRNNDVTRHVSLSFCIYNIIITETLLRLPMVAGYLVQKARGDSELESSVRHLFEPEKNLSK